MGPISGYYNEIAPVLRKLHKNTITWALFSSTKAKVKRSKNENKMELSVMS